MTRRVVVTCTVVYVTVGTTFMRPFVGGWSGTSLGDLHNLLLLRQYGDSWIPMRAALDTFRAGGRGHVYEQVFFAQHMKFQYPPSSLLLGDVLYHPRFLAVLGVLALAATAYVVWRILERSYDEGGLVADAADEARRRVWLALVAVGSVVVFYPTVRGVALGQIQTFLNLAAAGALLSWMRGRERSAGVLLGLACLGKPQYAVVVIWGALRGRWRLVASLAATFGAGLLVSVAVFGIHEHVEYLRVLSYLGRHGEAFWPNQSVNGLLHRLVDGGATAWSDTSYPPATGVVVAATLASSAALLGTAWFVRPRHDAAGGPADLAIMLLTATMASPIAWEHHYGILLPVYALLVPQLVHRHVFGRWTWPLVGASWVCTSSYLVGVEKVGDTPLSSYLLVGALVVLVALYRLRDGAPAPAAASSRPVAAT